MSGKYYPFEIRRVPQYQRTRPPDTSPVKVKDTRQRRKKLADALDTTVGYLLGETKQSNFLKDTARLNVSMI